jgi:hypothetical protein
LPDKAAVNYSGRSIPKNRGGTRNGGDPMNQPIDPVQLYYDFDREPFEPRRVHLLDGSIFDIPLREMVVIGVDYLDIGIQAEDEEPGICSTLEKVLFSEIREIEIVGSPSVPS